MLRLPLFFSQLAALLALATLAISASASPIQFTDEALFLSQTGAAAQAVPVTSTSGVHSLTAGSLTITRDGSSTLIGGDPVYGTPLPGINLVVSGPENFTVTAAPVFAFGFNIYEPTSPALLNGCNLACVDSTFEVQLFSGPTSLGSFALLPPDDTIQFYGFWNDVPFDKITIRETVGSADNEFFGSFYSGGVPPTEVPEPASLTLMMMGLAGLVWRRRT